MTFQNGLDQTPGDTNSTNAGANPGFELMKTQPETKPPASGMWEQLGLRTNKRTGGPEPNIHSAVVVLSRAESMEGAIALNTLTNRLQFVKTVDFSKYNCPARFEAGLEIDEDVLLQIRKAFNHVTGTDFGDTLTSQAVRFVGLGNKVHPIHDYLNGCVWDGVPRIDTWLTTYMHAEDTVYTRAVGAKWLVQAAARAFNPGCTADSMLVLEGDQDVGKNSIMSALSPNEDWLVTLHNAGIDKDLIVSMEGRWLAECAEMDIMKKNEMSALKSFITQKVDRPRKSYRRDHGDIRRSTVLWGGMNPNGCGWMRDETGNRRFWPVAVCGFVLVDGKPKLDCAGVARDRDQLWAETVVRLRSGASYLLNREEDAMAKAEQAARMEIHEWEPAIAKYLEMQGHFVKTHDILTVGLGLSTKEMRGGESKTVVRILTKLGWPMKIIHPHGRVYCRPKA